MNIAINPMSHVEAQVISAWNYPPPYDFYDLTEPGILAELLDGSYFVARNEASKVIGFFCYGNNAQVPAGRLTGMYDDMEKLDIGLGLAPNLTGRGYGVSFVTQGLAFGYQRFQPKGFRLSVATFNQRAIKVYQSAGFKPGQKFTSKTDKGDIEFLVMELAYWRGR